MKQNTMTLLLNPAHQHEHGSGSTVPTIPLVNTSTPPPANVGDVKVKDDGDEDEDGSTSEISLGEKNGFEFTKQEFKKSKKTGASNPLEGFGFASIKITDPFTLVSHFDTLCKLQNKTVSEERKVKKIVDGKEQEVVETYSRLLTGKEILVDLLQTAYDAKLRIKVKSLVPAVGEGEVKTDADLVTWLEKRAIDNPNKLLFSVDEAYNWIPGLRELSQAKKLEIKMMEVKELIAKYGAADPRVQALVVEIATGLK